MSNNVQLDANEVIQSLLGQISQLSQEKAMMQVQLELLSKNSLKKEDDVKDGSDTV